MTSTRHISAATIALGLLAGTAFAATAVSNGTYAAHTKVEATNGGFIRCAGGFDVQFTVSDGNIIASGHAAPIKNDGSFELHYALDANANTNITGNVNEASISGKLEHVGHTTTCRYSFTGARKS